MSLLLGVVLILSALSQSSGVWARTFEASTSYAPHFSGHIVSFIPHGFQPDGDPVSKIIIAGTLHDPGKGSNHLPDTPLVLAVYLESFQPATTPVLPDLLNGQEQVESLAGFMQGKSALVGAQNRTSFIGTALAETFLDNSVHLLLILDRNGASESERSLRLLGALTIYPDKSIAGDLHAEQSLLSTHLTALRVPHMSLAWQNIAVQLKVKVPPMMGTVLNQQPTALVAVPFQQQVLGTAIPHLSTPTTINSPPTPSVTATSTAPTGPTTQAAAAPGSTGGGSNSSFPLASGALIVLILLSLGMFWQRARRRG